MGSARAQITMNRFKNASPNIRADVQAGKTPQGSPNKTALHYNVQGGWG
jgi:hypothetical protein